MVDTDSIPFMIDTGSNRIIVDNPKYLTNLIPSSNKFKGVGGNCVIISGTGKFSLPLQSDNNTVDDVIDLQAVYVPSYPYNLVHPQILVNQTKAQNYNVN